MKKERHGLRYTVEYYLWLNIKARCHNPKNPSYAYYGGRGIHVCDEWRDSFTAFHRDMGCRPENHEIDREDNNGPYCPENCRWVKKVTNARNKKNSKWWYVFGVKYESLTHAADAIGVGVNTIKRWCEGRSDGGYVYPPKDNCWSELKYEKS